MDGSPSIVFGWNPDNKFFVGTKSVFNKKTPKINYTDKDIEKNHPDPELQKKLKICLQYLPKVVTYGIWQGDFLWSRETLKTKNETVFFRPNLIEYSLNLGHSSEPQCFEFYLNGGLPKKTLNVIMAGTGVGKTHSMANLRDHILSSELGIVIHTYYSSLEKGGTVNYNPVHTFLSTQEVVLHNNETQFLGPIRISSAFRTLMLDAEYQFQLHSPAAWDFMEEFADILKQYVNHCNKYQLHPKLTEFIDFLQEKKFLFAAHMAKKYESLVASAFEINTQLGNAKNELIKSMDMNGIYTFTHKIDGQECGPEGYVVSINNMPVKFVDRSHFSRLNRLARET